MQLKAIMPILWACSWCLLLGQVNNHRPLHDQWRMVRGCEAHFLLPHWWPVLTALMED